MPRYQISTRKWLQNLQLQSSNGFHNSSQKTLGRSGYANVSLGQRKVPKYSKQTCQRYDNKSSYELHTAQKDLYSAGSILRQIFYACREKLFNHPIEKIDYKKFEIIEKNEKNENKKSEIMILHFLPAENFGPALDDRLFRFPARQCKTLADQKALLSYDSCTAVNIYLKEVAEYLLRGATASMRGACVQLTGHKRKVVSSDGRTEYHDQRHDVLRVVLKESKKAYAIDVTSAQYGYYNPVTPWDDFAKTRLAGYNNLSFTKEEKRTAFDIHTGNSLPRFMFLLEVQATGHLVDWMKLWEQERKFDARKLLQLRKTDYKTRERELIHFIKKRICLDSKLVRQAYEMIKAREVEVCQDIAAKARQAEDAKNEAEKAAKARAEKTSEEKSEDSGRKSTVNAGKGSLEDTVEGSAKEDCKTSARNS